MKLKVALVLLSSLVTGCRTFPLPDGTVVTGIIIGTHFYDIEHIMIVSVGIILGVLSMILFLLILLRGGNTRG